MMYAKPSRPSPFVLCMFAGTLVSLPVGCFSDDPPPSAPDGSSGSDDSGTATNGTMETSADTTGVDTDTAGPTSDDTTDGAGCGNGVVDDGEECDDGNEDDADECSNACTLPSCEDGIANGGESDVDCGGPCEGCGEGLGCVADGDCGSANCYVDVCVPECTEWLVQYGTPDSDEGRNVTVDAEGNLYVAGRAVGPLDGEIPAGGDDVFLSKFEPDGTQLFTRMVGTPLFDMAEDVAVHTDGNILIAGRSNGDFGGQPNLGLMDGLGVMYNEFADEQWSVHLGTDTEDLLLASAFSSNGRSYLAGYTTGSYGGNVNGGGADLLLVKLDDDGTELWNRQLGGLGSQSAVSVVVDGDDNVIVAGYSSGEFEGNTALGGNDLIVAKFDSEGALSWTTQLGSDGDDIGEDVALDPDGNIYVGGWTEGSFEGQSPFGDRDLVVVKLDPDGAMQWATQYGSSDWDLGLGIAVDAEGTSYLSGLSRGDLGGNAVQGLEDASVVAFDAAGEVAWVGLLGTPQDEIFRGVEVGPQGEVYLTGFTRGDLGGANAGDADITVGRVCPPR